MVLVHLTTTVQHNTSLARLHGLSDQSIGLSSLSVRFKKTRVYQSLKLKIAVKMKLPLEKIKKICLSIRTLSMNSRQLRACNIMQVKTLLSVMLRLDINIQPLCYLLQDCSRFFSEDEIMYKII